MLIALVRRHLAGQGPRLAVLAALQLAAVLATLYLPTLNADIIDLGIARGDTGIIMRLGAVMLGISILQAAATVGTVWLASRLAMGLGRDLRARMFRHVGALASQDVERFGAPTLISRSTNDVTQVQTVVFMLLAMLASAPITMLGGVLMAVRTDVGLSWLVVVIVPLVGGVMGFLASRMVPQFRRMQASVDDHNRILREQITGIRVVRAFVREDHERARFGAANADLTGAGLAVSRIMALLFPAIMFMMQASSVAVLWVGAFEVDAGGIEVGALTAFMAYVTQILFSVMMVSFIATMVPRAQVSAGRITEVLGTPSSVVAADRGRTDLASPAGVEFRAVGFTHPGAAEPVLTDVTFSARPGQSTAVVGSTGSGKTTLVNLVPRLFDATTGEVLVGGVDVREALPDALWSRIGLVPQKAWLFKGTVASNLRHGNPHATDADLWEALRVAQADEFVAALPGGLDATIEQGGTNVSGGQRQRLSIARAVVRRPDVYLFDDSFSALDVATDARLRSALADITGRSTVITVAQRVSTIRGFDQIVVLDAGRVVGVGTHGELLESCPTYAEIAASQRATEPREVA